MEIKLKKLILENIKGIKSFEFPPDGRDALVRAENGVGKTTIYDAWLWLLFGKDSDGKTDFNVRPLDDKNQPIKGLVVATEGELLINGEPHILRKEQHEKIVKKEIKGFETICSIDEVPKKVGEYQEFIENLIPEEIFKMLTDLAYFNAKMHWSARRKVLLDIAGKIPKPAGFETLLANLNGRSLDDYQKVLADRKKGCEKERNEINPRIDELQRGLDEYVQNADEDKLEKRRDALQQTINALNKQREELLAAEKQRQQTIDQINHLTVERLHRESQLKNDTSSIQPLLEEKMQLRKSLAEQQNALSILNSKKRLARTEVEDIEAQMEPKMKGLQNVRECYKSIENEKLEDEFCFNCHQPLPEEMKRESKKQRLDNLREQGNDLKRQVDVFKRSKCEAEIKVLELHAEWEKANRELEETKKETDKRIAEIDKTLKKPVEVDPSTDEQWQKFTADIEKLQKELGVPVVEQMDVITTNVKAAQEKFIDINKSLAQADNAKKAKTRIEELENREQELAQLIADTEKEIDQIQQYRMQESRMIEAAVNGRFSHVEFKLFDYYLNGEINDKVCEAVYQGVPYPDMSSGQKIYCGIDIVNTLSDHYSVSVPLFIDHAESVTMPIEAESQTIRLQAVKGVKKLQVEIEQEAGKAVV